MKFKNLKKKVKHIKFPRNYRLIPAFVKTSAGKPENFKFSFPKINSATLVRTYRAILKAFVAFIFIVAVIIVGYDFKKNFQIKQDIDLQREALTKDLDFWEDFISINQNYRDAYFQASILEYKLGNASRAKEYVKKGLSLDQNSIDGKKLEKFLVNR